MEWIIGTYLVFGFLVACIVRNVGHWSLRVDDGPFLKSVLLWPLHLAGWIWIRYKISILRQSANAEFAADVYKALNELGITSGRVQSRTCFTAIQSGMRAGRQPPEVALSLALMLECVPSAEIDAIADRWEREGKISNEFIRYARVAVEIAKGQRPLPTYLKDIA